MHEVLVNRLGGLSLPRKSAVRLTDRPDMTLDVYRGRKTTIQQYNKSSQCCSERLMLYKCTVSNAPKTWLQPRVFIQDNVRYLQSFSCTKDLSAVKGFYVRLM